LEKRLDVILLHIQQEGKQLSFYVGENGAGYIPVFFSWETARELAEIMGKKFGLTLGFLVLKQVTQGSLEDNYVKALPKGLKYTFAYEGTPEFEALEEKVR
jgi:hypothetical protein